MFAPDSSRRRKSFRWGASASQASLEQLGIRGFYRVTPLLESWFDSGAIADDHDQHALRGQPGGLGGHFAGRDAAHGGGVLRVVVARQLLSKEGSHRVRQRARVL